MSIDFDNILENLTEEEKKELESYSDTDKKQVFLFFTEI